tara:strand:+ start:403 stop:1269 length:867 start_codon:yes stop_codon:yes gene_type:complete
LQLNYFLKNILFLYFLLLFSSSSYSQKLLSGYILDNETLEPLSYSTIIIENESRGTYSEIDGLFKLDTTSYSSKRMAVSHIGYKTKIIQLNSFKEKDTVVLVQEEHLLKEVVLKVYNQKLNEKWYKNNIKERTFITSPARGTTYAVLINKHPKKKFGSFELYYLPQKSSPQNKIRIKFLQRDINGNPSDNQLIRKDLIYTLPLNSERITIDLAYLNFIIPEKGFYIGIEFLGNKEDQVHSETTVYYTKKIRGNKTYLTTWNKRWLHVSKNIANRSRYKNLKFSYSIFR